MKAVQGEVSGASAMLIPAMALGRGGSLSRDPNHVRWPIAGLYRCSLTVGNPSDLWLWSHVIPAVLLYHT